MSIQQVYGLFEDINGNKGHRLFYIQLPKIKNLIYARSLNNYDPLFDLTSSNLSGESLAAGDFMLSGSLEKKTIQ